MRKFIRKALEKIGKMDRDQIGGLLLRIADENDLLAMVLESMTDGIVVTDREHRIILFNKAADRLLSLRGEDILEKLLWEALSDREISAFLEEKLANQEKVADREFILDSGAPRILSISILPLVRGGSIQGNLVHIEDVTEKRSKEARLRRAESLASLTNLAAGVAHEIKNPLGSIGIHLQLIQKKINSKSRIVAKDISQYLAVINEEVDRLNRIVVDFLFAVKPMDTRLEDGNINQVITELLDFVRPELEQAGVKIESDLSASVPMLRIDARFIKQALLNLIKNAVSAMPEGGSLRVQTLRSGDSVQIRVSDTGTGIPEQIMDKIFEPYFSTKPFGTGLGLTIVFKIVKEHFGDISVSSKPGEGATFTITLPIPQKEKMLIDYKGTSSEPPSGVPPRGELQGTSSEPPSGVPPRGELQGEAR
jgi:two-component system, sporulation sensor kinase E